MAARTWWLASGRGRPACGTRARTSAEVPSSTPTGCFPLPTALSSESTFLGCQQRGSRGGGHGGRGGQGDGRPTPAPLSFGLGKSVTSKNCLDLCPLHLDCPPPHLPGSSSSCILSPWACALAQTCPRRWAVSVLSAMRCGPASSHSFSSMSPHSWASDSRWGPGTACTASSRASLLITSAKPRAQEEWWCQAGWVGGP